MKKSTVVLCALLCLCCLVFSSCAQITELFAKIKYDRPATFIDTEKNSSSGIIGARFTSPPDFPWDDSLYMLGWVESCTYLPSDSIGLYFKTGLNDSYLPDGDLRITVDTEDFSVECGRALDGGVYILEGFFGEEYTKESPMEFCISLSARFDRDWAKGIVKIYVDYIPHNMNDFIQMAENDSEYDIDYLTERGCLSLAYSEIAYAADQHELRLDAENSGGPLYYDLLTDHYDMGLIGGEELGDLYYGALYRGRVCTPVHSYMPEEHTMKIGYYSENIRYQSDSYIADEVLWELYKAYEKTLDGNDYESEGEAALKFSQRMLLLLYERGVITAEEYETERNLMSREGTNGAFMPAEYPNEAVRNKVLLENKYTHFDPK